MIVKKLRGFTDSTIAEVVENVFEFRGKSNDVKPTKCEVGSVFIECDTCKVYLFDGSNWTEAE